VHLSLCYFHFMLSIRKLMSVVKDVDLEAMPSSIFVNDDDDDDNETVESRTCNISIATCQLTRARRVRPTFQSQTCLTRAVAENLPEMKWQIVKLNTKLATKNYILSVRTTAVSDSKSDPVSHCKLH